MTKKSDPSTLTIGFLICLWLFYLAMFTVNEYLCCTVCTPFVVFITFFGLLSMRKKKMPKFTVIKDQWPDEWTVLTIVLIFMIWLVFGILANSVLDGSFGSSTYNQEELTERMSTICLPICLLGTIILIALEIKHAKKARKYGATHVIKFDDNMSRAERVFLIKRGLKRAGISESILDEKFNLQKDVKSPGTQEPADALKGLVVPEILKFCPDCGSKVTIVEGTGKSYCGKCKKYIQSGEI